MIDETCETTIRRLFFAEHFKVGTICAQLGVHRSVVLRVIKADHMAPKAKASPSALDPYIPLIVETLKKYPNLTATRLHRMLAERGYKGSASQLRRRIRRDGLRPHKTEAFFRLHTLPGEEAQCDWADFGRIRVGNTERRIYALVIVLSWSRAIHVHFSHDQAFAAVARGHNTAFEAFGGAPRSMLYDNMKTVVLERDGQAVRFHSGLLDLASHYLFAPLPCRPRRPNEKGKVERAIRYMRDSFLAGLEFDTLLDLEKHFVRWRDEVAHQRPCPSDKSMTVAQALAHEQSLLLELPAHPFDDAETRSVIAHKQPYVRLDTNLYSIPWDLVSKPLTLVSTHHQVRVLDGQRTVACHRRSWERDRVITEADHLEGLAAFKSRAQSLSGRDLVCASIPKASELYEELLQLNESTAVHTRKLLELIETWGTEIVSLALEQAISRRSYSAHSVALIIDREFAPQQKPQIHARFEDSGAQALTITTHKLEEYDDI